MFVMTPVPIISDWTKERAGTSFREAREMDSPSGVRYAFESEEDEGEEESKDEVVLVAAMEIETW